jgi:hypothetical protein
MLRIGLFVQCGSSRGGKRLALGGRLGTQRCDALLSLSRLLVQIPRVEGFKMDVVVVDLESDFAATLLGLFLEALLPPLPTLLRLVLQLLLLLLLLLLPCTVWDRSFLLLLELFIKVPTLLGAATCSCFFDALCVDDSNALDSDDDDFDLDGLDDRCLFGLLPVLDRRGRNSVVTCAFRSFDSKSSNQRILQGSGARYQSLDSAKSTMCRCAIFASPTTTTTRAFGAVIVVVFAVVEISTCAIAAAAIWFCNDV